MHWQKEEEIFHREFGAIQDLLENEFPQNPDLPLRLTGVILNLWHTVETRVFGYVYDNIDRDLEDLPRLLDMRLQEMSKWVEEPTYVTLWLHCDHIKKQIARILTAANSHQLS